MMIRCAHDELVPIETLKSRFHPHNRNRHPPEQIERLSQILKYQGARYPAKISKQSGFITAGHGRILAAEKAGWKEYPVNYQEYDDADQEYADLTADNTIALWAELDLSGINSDLADLGPDFDIEMLGIKDFVIDMSEKNVDLVNKGDENSAWVGMPEFKKGVPYINLIFQFKTYHDRETYVSENNLKIDHKHNNQWIIRK